MPGNDVELVWRGDHLTLKKNRLSFKIFPKNKSGGIVSINIYVDEREIY
jgi:hypothetical protein